MDERLRRVFAFIPALAAVLVLAVVPLPMFAVGPGPSRDVIPLIQVKEVPVHQPEGNLLLTTVTFRHASIFDALRGWLDQYVEVVPERQILPPGVSQEEEQAIQLSQMDESKLTAAAVALERVTDYPEDHRAGALVRRVEPGSPADGVLFPGDLIVRVAGSPVGEPADVARLAGAAEAATVAFTVRVDDVTRTARLRPEVAQGAIRGLDLIANFPFPVLIESGDIGGPSAGLMWAVGLVDLLTPGDLTAGRRIAGTGTIDPAGGVGPIGGIGQKLVAAQRSGAELFLVPRADFGPARASGIDIELVPVDDLEDALRFLSSTCGCPGV